VVRLDPSRIFRGRSIPWAQVERVTTRRYKGKGGGVTVAKVHTVTGRTYFLPAPRTTAPYDDPEFYRTVRYLQGRAQSR
jgi:hypothetical protein